MNRKFVIALLIIASLLLTTTVYATDSPITTQIQQYAENLDVQDAIQQADQILKDTNITPTIQQTIDSLTSNPQVQQTIDSITSNPQIQQTIDSLTSNPQVQQVTQQLTDTASQLTQQVTQQAKSFILGNLNFSLENQGSATINGIPMAKVDANVYVTSKEVKLPADMSFESLTKQVKKAIEASPTKIYTKDFTIHSEPSLLLFSKTESGGTLNVLTCSNGVAYAVTIIYKGDNFKSARKVLENIHFLNGPTNGKTDLSNIPLEAIISLKK